MLEKLLAKIEAYMSGNFVPRTEHESVSAKLSEVTARSATTEVMLEETAAKLESTAATLGSATKERDDLKAENDKLKAEAKTVEQSASAKAIEICASQGIKTSEMPKSDAAPAVSSESELQKLRLEMAAEPDALKRSKMAARCRELRGHGDLFKAA